METNCGGMRAVNPLLFLWCVVLTPFVFGLSSYAFDCLLNTFPLFTICGGIIGFCFYIKLLIKFFTGDF